MIRYSRNSVRTILNLVFDSTKVKWFALYHTNLSHEVLLSFVWLKFSSFGWDVDMRRIRSDKTLSLGIPKAPQGNIQGITKQLSLGMPRKASPLSSPTLSITSLGAMFSFVTWYVFFLEHHFILLGFSCCFLEYCFASFFSIKKAKDSLYHAYFAIIHVAVWKQKVYRCCKNSLEKSESDIILILLHSLQTILFWQITDYTVLA